MTAAKVLALLALALAARAAASQVNALPQPLGWWGTACCGRDDIADTAARTQLAMIAGSDVDTLARLTAEAVARHQRVVVILWELLLHQDPALVAAPGTMLRVDWQARLKDFTARVWARHAPSTFFAYYLADEPGLWARKYPHSATLPGRIRASLDLIAQQLPPDGYRMVSLSVPEVDGSVDGASMLPPSVDLVGGNFYTLTGSPAAATPTNLARLAALVGPKRKLYLTLDAVASGSGPCAVDAATQRALIANNDAMRAWAAGRSTVVAQIAYTYANVPEQRLCGAESMPLVLADITRSVIASTPP